MGFDIECVIDLQSYPGEYFCPVCRTLVYPSEAIQAQCTHVYCKPCLAHVTNGTRACPYDGYLVTESDSKPLMESDKPLAEKIGKVKVHCLFFRSGCTWEGTLSDSASHGAVCSFGNSPVICNRCGVQIVHRQVHEHAQVCPGVYDGGLTKSGTTSSTVPAVANPPVSQAQNPPQNVVTAATPTPLPVQNNNVQTSQPTAAALTAPEQWYQQQYYQQQYAGYDPYQQQQQQQQYYQQQPFQQQYQQQVPVQGQPQAPAQQPQPHLAQPPQMQAPMQNYQQPMRPQVLPPPPPPTQPSQHPPQAVGVRPPAQHQQMPQYQQQPMHHSQPHMQTQMAQPYTQPSTAPQSQPYQSQSQPPMFHPQPQPNNLPQPPPHPPVSGHQSYQQPPPAQNMQQHPVPQQPALMRPPQNHGSVSQQPSTLLPPQNQQFLPHGQQPTYPVQFRPPMQPVPPSHYAQQQQSLAPFQGQMHQPPPQQSQNYVGMPMMPNQGIHSQNHSVSSAGFGPLAPSGPAQLASTQTSINQNHANPTILEQNATAHDKNFEGESVGENETALKDANNAAKDGLVKSDINQKKGDMMGTLEQSFGGKSSEDELRKVEAHSLKDSVPLKQGNIDNQMMLPKTAVAGQSSANYDRQSQKLLSREQPNFFPREPGRPLEQGSRSHGPIYDAGSKLDPGDMGPHSGFLPHRPSGPELGQHHNKPFPYQTPGGDYLSSPPRRFGGPSSFTHGSSSLDDFNSREPHRFGERSMSSNLPPDLFGNSFRDGRFPPSSHLRRGDIDGPMNPRFGEHMPPAQIHNQIGNEDVFWTDGPGHLTRGKPSGPGYLPGHGYTGEVVGNFPRPPFSETAGGDMPGYPPFGDPAMRNNYPFHGFPNTRNYSGVVDSIDQSRNRKLPSSGWCRVCEFDCDAVEGLEMHSQTREHRNMVMDMVKSIKLKIKKQHRVSAGRMSHEGGRSRKMGSAGRGKRH